MGPDPAHDEPSVELALARNLGHIDRVEEYTAAHSDTFEDVLRWPAVRFEAAWEAFNMRRRLEALDDDYRAMVTALYANSAMDGQQLEKAINSMHNNFKERRAEILGSQEDTKSDDEFVSDKWW